MKLRAIFLAGLLFSPSVAMSQASTDTLFRWTDSEGNLVVSDRPPPAGTAFEEISASSGMVNKLNVGDPVQVPARSKPTAATDSQQGSEKTRTVYEKNPAYCEQAKKNLEVLDTAARIRMPDATGEMRYLNDEERTAERNKNLETIQLHCE